MFKEILGDAFPIIERAAPVLASVLGSPIAGAGTSFAVTLLADAFGLKNNDVPAIAQQINSNPQSEQVLSAIENRFGEILKSSSLIKQPSQVEINLKITWPDSNV